jgi:hypothetical protein
MKFLYFPFLYVPFFLSAFALTFCFGVSSAAGTYRFNRARTTTAQEFVFCQKTLTEILSPEGYVLDENSIDISDEVPMPPLQTPVIIETPEFAVHTVLFEVKRDELKFRGMTYLILLSVQKTQNSSLKNQIIVNSTAQTLQNYLWSDSSQTTLSLAISPSYPLFKAEIRPRDLMLLQLAP